ncbi:hypothetical protein DRO02_03005 [archaeon]|nr:MAG: hypothetical protein DRO21_02890 [archaeon]RLG65024.1 MAG: hypothetical protein DRO02_03005 [archaeon]HDM23596.1 hypothetical protein [Candidatus Bathyarchaeota archaeon]
MEICGFIGMILILVFLVSQMGEIRKKKWDLSYVISWTMYTIGCLLLTIHAFLINDIPFIVVNAVALVLAMLNTFFSIAKRK